MLIQNLKKILYNNQDVYEGFDWNKYPNTLSPGSMPANELLQQIIRKESPSLIIEVGSFLGFSAVGMTQAMMEKDKDGVTICVDSWMGGADHWEDIRIKRVNGYPTFYYNFLANICHSGLQNNILPIALPSNTASVVLQKAFKEDNIKADVIYIDGSHEPLDVFYDCLNYWELLKDGGIMFGDDWTCEGVVQGVYSFCNEKSINSLQIHPNQVHWLLKK
jgi:predicted O-methyltransferase YrrM